MSAHSLLSPSSSERWISCPASVRMTQQTDLTPEKSSVYAIEGTAFHALAELHARHHLLDLSKPKFNSELKTWRKEYEAFHFDEEEMTEYATGYVAYLRSRLEAEENSRLLLEQRLPTGVPDCWGTSDAVIVSPTTVEICDAKYGLGVKVEAVGNPQLRLYGVGALDTYGDLLGDVKQVRLTVYQPRLDHVASEELPAAELRAWRNDVVIPRAKLALGPDAPFGPSEEACRWCPASGSCMAQMEWATTRDFGLTPDFMDDNELASALDQLSGIKAWCAAVEAYTLRRAYSDGKPIPGYKVVMSGGKRSIVDHEGALEALLDVGYEEDAVSTRKVKGIGELEKLLKRSFDDVVGSYVKKGDGSPSLVPESDKREAIDPEGQAAKDFTEEVSA